MPHSEQAEKPQKEKPTLPQSLQLDSDAFTRNLAAFHEERGYVTWARIQPTKIRVSILTTLRTTLEVAPRVAGKSIDLQRLYQIVLNLGGYDQVSRTKLAWRKIGLEFHLGANNAGAYAFALKSTYYKNLAAFEIKDYHSKTPPPKEILEDLTARGGDLLTRTVENHRQPTVEETEASGEEEVRTPNGDKMDIDEPGSGTGRSTRGLRQAPPQRVLFQPDVSSSRQTRTATGHGQSPQPTTAPSSGYSYAAATNQNSMPHNLASYEPRPPMPLTLRGVVAPANNSTRFYQQVAQLQNGLKRKAKDMTKPGCGYDGPNIYVRTLQALRSGIPAEQHYALHHLVKISHERGDKFRFEAFPNLAEALTEYILGITSEYYDIHWKIGYMETDKSMNVLDGINGTPGLIDRLKSLARIDVADELEPREKSMHFEKVKEAGLTMRNLSLMEDNAKYLSEMAEIRDMLTIVLSLPDDPRLIELKHYMLDIAEMVTRFWVMPENDPLYRILLDEVKFSSDRGAILTCLRAICRISMNLKDNNNLLSVPITIIEKLTNYLLLQDEELVGAALDFLYQYTAVPSNVAILLSHSNNPKYRLAPLMKELCRLLRYGEVEVQSKFLLQEAIPDTPAEKIPDVPNDLLRQLLQLDEPERSNTWLKCVFEEHEDSEITQIALWQAYQSRFTPYSNGVTANAPGLLPAAEFIKNVSIIFETATAQVVPGQTSKFIIKGIRPRHTPVNTRQHTYLRCLWRAPTAAKLCGEFFPKPEDLYNHILSAHIGITRHPEGSAKAGKWDTSDSHTINASVDCHWARCHRFAHGTPRLEKTKGQLASHIKVHLPSSAAKSKQPANRTPANATHPFHPNTLGPHGAHDPGLLAGPDGKSPLARSEIDGLGREAVYQTISYYNSPVDEHHDPAGLSLSAVLVLRNLARNIPKAAERLRNGDVEVEKAGDKGTEQWVDFAADGRDSMKGGSEWLEECFGGEVGESLMWSLGFNRKLGGYVADVIGLIRKGKGE
ncbi:MAG: hypothetical protein L6R39_007113 [Caloplaca ligustica]|nr:MAG: hypothetical protein L6R39_007113 [Caloplaca ligustica]